MSIWKKFVEFFMYIPKRIRVYIANSLTITSNIKEFLESPIADVLITIIPSDWDDKARRLILGYLQQIMPLLIVVDACKEEVSLENMMQCWIRQLKTFPKPVQDALLHKLASLLTAMQDLESLKTRKYDTYVQRFYEDSVEMADKI